MEMDMSTIEWNNLEHAYGSAANIPALLDQLTSFPAEDSFKDEPWYSLWSSLYHQGEIFSASLAVIPEIAAKLACAPERATMSFFALPASIEVAREKSGMRVPDSIGPRYQEAFRHLAIFAFNTATTQPESELGQAALAIMAVAAGQHAYAELILEVPKGEVGEVLEWYQSR
jgi:hypothetical protein